MDPKSPSAKSVRRLPPIPADTVHSYIADSPINIIRRARLARNTATPKHSTVFSPQAGERVDWPRSLTFKGNASPLVQVKSRKKVSWKDLDPEECTEETDEVRRRLQTFGHLIRLGEAGYLSKPQRKTY